MDIHGTQKILHDELGSGVGPVEDVRLEPVFEVEPARITEVAALLKNHPELRFDCLLNLTGTDHPGRRTIRIAYELFSYESDDRVVVRVDTEREKPVVPSVAKVWRAAEWLEREVYDLLGVDFPGHRDLRRILLPDDWVGHPLRKDYVEQTHYHGISTVRESALDIPGRY